MPVPDKQQIQHILSHMHRLTGRRYPKLEAELSKLSFEALRDLGLFTVDAEAEVTIARNRAYMGRR